MEELKAYNCCKKCNELNILVNNKLKHKDCITKTGEQLKVTYYVCSSCREINVVQLDNEQTLLFYEEIKNLMVETMKKRINKETVSPKVGKKQKRLSKQLNRLRTELNNKYSGCVLLDENKNIFIECLTVNEVK